MLNEGIHVDDISGVILLRPTVSPIIYKQQIGRALSEDGLTIGVWVRRQRLIRSGAVEGWLTESQITRLEELGFSWEDHQTKRWNDVYERFVK